MAGYYIFYFLKGSVREGFKLKIEKWFDLSDPSQPGRAMDDKNIYVY